ncbi:Aldehyde/histidinol dehydrogenase [Phyllosticta capitalensis]|uniref:Aldehyde/histidinol dehydrogenase n=1 Tax=Phyllosticta capitalensis TaxID=121624 RepID=UPI003131379F
MDSKQPEAWPELKYTPSDAIPGTAKAVRSTFRSGRTRPIEYRLKQLRKFYWGLKDNEQLILDACKKDLGKAHFETYLAELNWVLGDILFQLKGIPKWSKDESAPDIPLINKGVFPKIRKDPLGAVLVIGAYNFPIQLSLGPFIGAIAAGCTAVLKPSENAPAAAAAMEKVIRETLDPESYTVVQGGVAESSMLLDQKWDKIFYTGGASVGKIIAKKAAETLTPVTLELGGNNPAILAKHADPRLAARRLLWAKMHNAGQVCVSQNYTMVDKDILPLFVAELKKAFEEFFPHGAQKSPDYARIINERQFKRLKKMLDESSGKILIGGTMDESDLFFEPTVVEVDSMHDSLIQEESFGPLMPILPVENLDEAIRIANEVDETPLGIYPFGNKAETNKVLNSTLSGGASVNDGFFHASIPTLQFGGVGTSGQGAYRGKASFETFTHRRPVTTTPSWIEGFLAVRYPPYTAQKQSQYRSMSGAKADFDREGNVRGWGAWLWTLLTLGARGKKAALVRVVLVFVGKC